MGQVILFPGVVKRVVDHLKICGIHTVDVKRIDNRLRFTCDGPRARVAAVLAEGQSIKSFVASIVSVMQVVGDQVVYKDA